LTSSLFEPIQFYPKKRLLLMIENIDLEHLEVFDYVRLKILRVVRSPIRAKRLRKRGEKICWSNLVGAFVWEPEQKH